MFTISVNVYSKDSSTIYIVREESQTFDHDIKTNTCDHALSQLTCNLTGKDSQYTEIVLSIMLALCLMLSGTYYAQNYASIIGWCLAKVQHYRRKPPSENVEGPVPTCLLLPCRCIYTTDRFWHMVTSLAKNFNKIHE